jgi:poly(3-hydroxybutyrate) depolymerase
MRGTSRYAFVVGVALASGCGSTPDGIEFANPDGDGGSAGEAGGQSTGATGATGNQGGNGNSGGSSGANAGETGGADAGESGAGGTPAFDPTVGPAGAFDETTDVDGISRGYRLHVPDSAVAHMKNVGPAPLLITLHGAGDEGTNFITATRLTQTADANGFVLIGAPGYNRGWFVQANEGWPGTDGNDNSLQNDAEFMLQLIEKTSADYSIDTNAIFLAGFSRGAGCTGLFAMFSGSFAIASGNWVSPFAAYGINAGYDATGGNYDLTKASPKRPIWIIHGSADNVVPLYGGEDFATALDAAGWDITFDTVEGAPHNWLFDNQELWDFFMDNAG